MSFDACTHTFLNLYVTKNVPMQHQQTFVVSTFSPQPATCDIARHLTSPRVTANCLFKKQFWKAHLSLAFILFL